MMNIFLLTHPRELQKKTNTGSLVVNLLEEKAKIIVWDRVKPNPELLEYIAEGSIALLYPSTDEKTESEISNFQNYIIIDSTWQEAQKIVNQSPYLHNLPRIDIKKTKPSLYNLRRNQREDCLCTAECAIEILNAKKLMVQAHDLHISFLQHLELQKK